LAEIRSKFKHAMVRRRGLEEEGKKNQNRRKTCLLVCTVSKPTHTTRFHAKSHKCGESGLFAPAGAAAGVMRHCGVAAVGSGLGVVLEVAGGGGRK
jgi:hypothetical protein